MCSICSTQKAKFLKSPGGTIMSAPALNGYLSAAIAKSDYLHQLVYTMI